jgi:hypothetical protein
MADPNAVLKRAMTSLSVTGKLAVAFATEHDCPVAVVFLYQIFDVGSRAHGSRLATECMKIGKLNLCRHSV